MIRTVVDYLRKQFAATGKETGKVSLQVDVIAGAILSFGIDAQVMEVDWGDGNQSGIARCSEQFTHQYEKAGIYQIIVTGEHITNIDIPGSCIIALDVSACQTLEFINCDDNQLTELDIRNCRHLYELYCANNRIKELQLGKYDKLFYLSCSGNELEFLDLSGCRHLVELRCCGNRLHSLDVSHCPKLVSVNLEENAFDHNAFFRFLSTLRSRPSGESGFLLFSGIDNHLAVRDYINKKGWHEI